MKAYNQQQIIFGGMGLGGSWNPDEPVTQQAIDDGCKIIEKALNLGITFFDFADIYTFGKAESVMGEYLKNQPETRSQILIQSKVGIKLNSISKGASFDYSYDHIVKSVDAILKRLNTDYLDLLLLHRPDPLMDVKELKAAIDHLFETGKIKDLGVSNMNHHQIAYLQKVTGRKIVVNQLELSLKKSDFVYSQVGFNNPINHLIDFPIGTLEYCMSNDIALQAWSPLAKGIYSGKYIDNPTIEEQETISYVQTLSQKYRCSKEAIVLGWLMTHPASISPVIGTTNEDRMAACYEASDMTLERSDWYELLTKARGVEMP